MVEHLKFVCFLRIYKFRYKTMDVWIPFKVPSKSMYSGNHAKFITNRNIFEYIVSIRKLYLFEFISTRFIGENGNGVSGSDKQ